MNELKVFDYENAKIRVIGDGDNPWFVAEDVCKYFGIVNSRSAVSRLYENEKGVSVVDTLGGQQQVSVINESGLYHLMFTITPANARGISQEERQRRQEQRYRFIHWVTNDVIPAIRKYGVYAVDEVLENPDMLIHALQAYKVEREKRKFAERQVSELKPKADYCDIVLKSPSLVKTSVIAKDYGMSASAFNRKLHELGVQYRQSDIWLLYSKYQNEGYTATETFEFQNSNTGETGTKIWTEWTQKGRLFLYQLLKKHGILPAIERGDNNAT